MVPMQMFRHHDAVWIPQPLWSKGEYNAFEKRPPASPWGMQRPQPVLRPGQSSCSCLPNEQENAVSVWAYRQPDQPLTQWAWLETFVEKTFGYADLSLCSTGGELDRSAAVRFVKEALLRLHLDYVHLTLPKRYNPLTAQDWGGYLDTGELRFEPRWLWLCEPDHASAVGQDFGAGKASLSWRIYHAEGRRRR